MLRPEGVLTVMFTHKKQEAWEALFASLIEAGFTITATWLDGWDGSEPPPTVWNSTQLSLEGRATATLQNMRQRAQGVDTEMRQQQLKAARLRLSRRTGTNADLL